MVKTVEAALRDLAQPEKAYFYPRFFKAGPGQYAEGDQFLGVVVPEQKKVAKAYFKEAELDDIALILRSPLHEMRLTALFMLNLKFEKAPPAERETLAKFYLENLPYVNNWDLVDSTAYKILGRYAFENDKAVVLYHLAERENMWEKRVAIVATMYFLKKKQTQHTKEIALKNLTHPHDLMHKANGWLLREMGKVNEDELVDFLQENYSRLPRTTLRYAIEKFDNEVRQQFLKGEF